MVYLDNAATGGMKPKSVTNAVLIALEKFSANPGRSGHSLSIKTAEKIFECREKVAALFGCSHPENVVFTMNCTHALNCVIKGVLKKGDHVVVSDFEHNAVIRPLETLKRKGMITYDTATVSLTDNNVTLENFKSCIKSNTKMIICTHASNVTGRVLPIREIGQLCKERKILFTVDAAQSAGVLDINIKKQNIDFLCLAPHKGLFSPSGIGVLIAEKPIYDVLIEGGTGSSSLNLVQPLSMPDRLESGTTNVPAIFGLCAGIDYLNSYKTEKIYEHELNLLQKIYRELKGIEDVVLYTPFPKANEYVPVLPYNFKNVKSDVTASVLNNYGIAVRSGLQCAPLAHRKLNTVENGVVRISIGAFNNNREVDYLLNVLKNNNFRKKLYNAIE